MALARDLVSARIRSFERVSPESVNGEEVIIKVEVGVVVSIMEEGRVKTVPSVSPVLGLILSVVTGHLIAQCPK